MWGQMISCDQPKCVQTVCCSVEWDEFTLNSPHTHKAKPHELMSLDPTRTHIQKHNIKGTTRFSVSTTWDIPLYGKYMQEPLHMISLMKYFIIFLNSNLIHKSSLKTRHRKRGKIEQYWIVWFDVFNCWNCIFCYPPYTHTPDSNFYSCRISSSHFANRQNVTDRYEIILFHYFSWWLFWDEITT